MFNKILLTLSTRGLITLIGFITVLLTTQFLGAEGRGIVTLIILAITIVMMINSVFGGTTLVYLIPRANVTRLSIPAYIWNIFSCILLTLFLDLLGLIPESYAYHIMLISILQAFASVNSSVLLAKERIKAHNILQLVQNGGLLLCLAILLAAGEVHIMSYVISLYAGHGLSMLISVLMTYHYFRKEDFKIQWPDILKMFRYGFLLQTAYLLQTLNFRVSYYILEHYSGAAEVGIYSVGTTISESIWIATKSIAIVLFSRLCNMEDRHEAARLSVMFSKVGFIMTFVFLVPLLLLPELFYQYIFGPEFGASKMVILTMAPGIAALGAGIIFAHYFAGTGQYVKNTLSAITGLSLTLIFAFILIPNYGLAGAGITASISYIGSTIFVIYIFLKERKYSFKDLWITKMDMLKARELLSRLAKKIKHEKH